MHLFHVLVLLTSLILYLYFLTWYKYYFCYELCIDQSGEQTADIRLRM